MFVYLASLYYLIGLFLFEISADDFIIISGGGTVAPLLACGKLCSQILNLQENLGPADHSRTFLAMCLLSSTNCVVFCNNGTLYTAKICSYVMYCPSTL